MNDEEILMTASDAGFMVSTQYGQDGPYKLMPVSDKATLIKFARSIIWEVTYDDR